ncbi:MAG: Fic family protein [Defluviitaleaceae bacterium]|nr:Fic family protein [Defluviitaleaceae bacterium]
MKKLKYTITDKSQNLVGQIIKRAKSQHSLYVERGKMHQLNGKTVKQMHRDICIRFAHATIAMKNSELTLVQASHVINGEYTELAPKDIIAVKNAYEAYSQLYHDHFHNTAHTVAYSISAMQNIHGVLMTGLPKEAGCFTSDDSFGKLHRDFENLVEWLKDSKENMLIKACVFHYELIVMKPFGEGSEHVSRIWHMLLLNQRNGIYVSNRIPTMNVIYERRHEYYDILSITDRVVGCTKFIEFILQAMLDALIVYEKDSSL